MSPMPRVGRQASSLLLIGVLCAAALLVGLGAPVLAQGDGGAPTDANDTTDGGNGTGALPGGPGVQRIYTITAIETDPNNPATFEWDVKALLVQPGEQVILVADLSDAGNVHNIHIGPAIDEDPDFDVAYTPAGSTDPAGATASVKGQEVSASFTVPAEFESTRYWCTLHSTMRGTLGVTVAGGEAGEPIHHLGVHFLAYWVGLIAFAILFIVYGITFFLFKYNETSATTDQWDRTGAGAPDVKNSMSSGRATLFAILIGIVALAAIVYLARMG